MDIPQKKDAKLRKQCWKFKSSLIQQFYKKHSKNFFAGQSVPSQYIAQPASSSVLCLFLGCPMGVCLHLFIS